MRRMYAAVGVLACVLVLAPAGQAERVAGSPKKLWSEFPLEQKGQQTTPAPRPAEPFLPPIATDSSEAGAQSDWIVWLAVAGAGALVLLLVARPLATSRSHVGGRRLRALSARTRDLGARARDARPSLRMPTRPRRRAGPRRRRRVVTQYAPVSVVAEPAAPPETVPYVTRRSGLVRARYVVLVDEGGSTSELRRSRAFWQIGRGSWQRRMAENAWDALANDLRAEGWEVDLTGRFEYFVPLRRAIISTLEPYTRWERTGRTQS
jgi:hypothetical protein